MILAGDIGGTKTALEYILMKQASDLLWPRRHFQVLIMRVLKLL
jgi:hypothetical protein